MSSWSIRATNSRYAWTMTCGLEDFMDTTTSKYPSSTQMRKNSRALSTMPNAVSP